MSGKPEAALPTGITLGFPLDQLLDQECGLIRRNMRKPAIKVAEEEVPSQFRPADIVDVDGFVECLKTKDAKDAPWKTVVNPLVRKGLRQAKAEKNVTIRRCRCATAIASALNDCLDPYRFGQLFFECRKRKKGLKEYESPQEQRRFIEAQMREYVAQTPHHQTATGNVVICGEPGTAKSTLALQLAACCARPEMMNASVPLYISLEATPSELRAKARPFGWDRHLRELRHLQDVGEVPSAQELGDILKTCVSNYAGTVSPSRYGDSIRACPAHLHPKEWPPIGRRACGQCTEPPTEYHPCILVSSLSARPLEAKADPDTLFETRFQQLERLLEAGQAVRDDMCECQAPGQWHIRHFMPLVVIDSLNMLGMRPLSRDEMYRLFTLFKRCRTTGVFVIETSQATPFDSTMADVVISLRQEEDNGYTFRYIEIEKSRYYHQVYGRHPFRTLPFIEGATVPAVPEYDRSTCQEKPPRHGVVIYPSLHYLVLKTDRERQGKGGSDSGKADAAFDFGHPAFKQILPDKLRRNKVVMLAGSRGTFKSTFGFNFLARGLMRQESESGLLIRLSETSLLESGKRKSRPYPKTIPPCFIGSEDGEYPRFQRRLLTRVSDKDDASSNPCDELWQNLAPTSKILVTAWQYDDPAIRRHGHPRSRRHDDPTSRLFEMDFKGGALLPEEFVQIVREILIRRQGKDRIRRVVLDDVSQIGVSYPFLRHSRTSGDLLLSTFVHLMRNDDVDLVMIGTTGELGQANDMVSRACALADTVVSCRFLDVFGDRYATVSGEGLMAGTGTHSSQMGESVPAVVKLQSIDTKEFGLDIDCHYLEGLVGFETGQIHRPGLSVHLYQEVGAIHRQYNKEIETMLQSGLWTAADPRAGERGRVRVAGADRVTVRVFGPKESEVMHDGLKVLGAKAPIDKTAVVAVDEFWSTPEYAGKRFTKVPSGKQNLRQLNETVRRKIEKDPVVWPYYLNVLLLAYRKREGSTAWPPKAWRDVLRYVEEARESIRRDKPSSQVHSVRRPFWYDHAAAETLACALLDAIATANPTGKPKPEEDAAKWREYWDRCLGGRRPGNRGKLTAPEAQELEALHDVLHLIRPTKSGSSEDQEDDSKTDLLPPDADVYLLWYSQLRDLIEQSPRLASELRVCPLPGGGFAGDWYLGIVEGSVSVALGTRIIEILYSKEEQHKRLARGVGLPFLKEFEKPGRFIAWPGAYAVPLRDVYEIHNHAMSRADITGYDRCRSAIVTIAKGLAPIGDPAKPPVGVSADIHDIGDRLFKQIAVLRKHV